MITSKHLPQVSSCRSPSQSDTGTKSPHGTTASQSQPDSLDKPRASPSPEPAISSAGQSLLRALCKPAASSLGVSRARQHLTNMRTKLNEAKQAGRQLDKDLRDLSTILRRWLEGATTQCVSWTDEDGHRQVNVRLSEAEIQQVETDLDNHRLRQDDHISSLERLVDGAQRNAEGAQRDFDSNLQFQSNMSRMQHQTSMHIIGNIGR